MRHQVLSPLAHTLICLLHISISDSVTNTSTLDRFTYSRFTNKGGGEGYCIFLSNIGVSKPHPWHKHVGSDKLKSQTEPPHSLMSLHVSMEIKHMKALGKEPGITEKLPWFLPPLNHITSESSETHSLSNHQLFILLNLRMRFLKML